MHAMPNEDLRHWRGSRRSVLGAWKQRLGFKNQDQGWQSPEVESGAACLARWK